MHENRIVTHLNGGGGGSGVRGGGEEGGEGVGGLGCVHHGFLDVMVHALQSAVPAWNLH